MQAIFTPAQMMYLIGLHGGRGIPGIAPEVLGQTESKKGIEAAMEQGYAKFFADGWARTGSRPGTVTFDQAMLDATLTLVDPKQVLRAMRVVGTAHQVLLQYFDDDRIVELIPLVNGDFQVVSPLQLPVAAARVTAFLNAATAEAEPVTEAVSEADLPPQTGEVLLARVESGQLVSGHGARSYSGRWLAWQDDSATPRHISQLTEGQMQQRLETWLQTR
jgi:hypothetical protein